MESQALGWGRWLRLIERPRNQRQNFLIVDKSTVSGKLLLLLFEDNKYRIIPVNSSRAITLRWTEALHILVKSKIVIKQDIEI